MTSVEDVQCFHCKNFKGPVAKLPDISLEEPKVSMLACRAFPEGIPMEIINGKFDHKKPYKGDHGVRFEEGAPEALKGDVRE